jgi:ADP-ribose pyrophosphatase
LPDGTEATREYVVHPGAVMIVPLLEKPGQPMQLVMERQFRYPVQQVMLEFPAGKLDPNESTLQCAQRELFEETGYSAKQWARAGVMHPVISYSTEFIEIWFAKDLSLGERQLDPGEFLEVITKTPEALQEACLKGEVTDGKTLTGMFWLQNYLSGRHQLNWVNAA